MNGAKEKVKLPAIGLLVTAGIGILTNCLSIVYTIVIMVGGSSAAMATAGKDDQTAKTMALLQGPVGIVSSVIPIIVAVVVIYGGLKMMKLQSYPLALTAAVLTAIPLPCVSPCCCIGIFTGIWAIVVLMNQEVKTAFQGQIAA